MVCLKNINVDTPHKGDTDDDDDDDDDNNNNNNNNNTLLQILSCKIKNKCEIFKNVIDWNHLKTEFLSGRLKRCNKGAGIEISGATGFDKVDQCSVAGRCRGSPFDCTSIPLPDIMQPPVRLVPVFPYTNLKRPDIEVDCPLYRA